MSEWISVGDSLPDKELQMNTVWFDVWIVASDSDKYRVPDVKFREGLFYEQILTEYNDLSHEEDLSDITHWRVPEPP